MKDFITEFKDFVNRGNLVELAVAFTLTLFFVPVVNAIVDGVIMQLIAGIFGQPSFDSITIDVGDAELLIGTRHHRTRHVPDRGVRVLPDRQGLQRDEGAGRRGRRARPRSNS